MTVSLLRSGQVLDSLPAVRFGFREVTTRRRDILLNGHPGAVPARLDREPQPQHLWSAPAGWPERLRSSSRTQLCWYDVWPSGWPLVNEDILDPLDETGCGALMLAPTVVHFRDLLLTDPKVEAAHEDMLQRWVRKYRNHPSILAWLPSMNYVGNHANIHADGMGRSTVTVNSTNEKVLAKSIDMIKAIDPTRLAFGHADGEHRRRLVLERLSQLRAAPGARRVAVGVREGWRPALHGRGVRPAVHDELLERPAWAALPVDRIPRDVLRRPGVPHRGRAGAG
ncbi:MAG: hypothetical protein M5U09_18435 [Gammaproteobacteria bacterium]|nr:hypothetical protein [Gammaproteobacteria bacterium]